MLTVREKCLLSLLILSTLSSSVSSLSIRVDRRALRRDPLRTPLRLNSLPVATVATAAREFAASAFSAPVGPTALLPSAGINLVLFSALRPALLGRLTVSGAAHAFALAVGLWASVGPAGWSVAVAYFFLGSAVTKVRFREKEAAGIAEGRGGRRGPENVWGSAATALACAALSASAGARRFLGLDRDLLLLGFVAALSTKLADTFASEIGKAYGKTTFMIIPPFNRCDPGTEGGVSAEGTAAAAVGGFILSVYGAWALKTLTFPMVLVSTLSAFVATNVESVLGATMQGKSGFEWMSNEVVNFINTLIGAGMAMALGKFILRM